MIVAGEAFGAAAGAVDDGDFLAAQIEKMPDEQFAHLAGADDDDPGSAEAGEKFLGLIIVNLIEIKMEKLRQGLFLGQNKKKNKKKKK